MVKLFRFTVSLPPVAWSPQVKFIDTQQFLGRQTWARPGPWKGKLEGETQYCHQPAGTLGMGLTLFAHQFPFLWSGVMRAPTSGLVMKTTLHIHKAGASAPGKDLVSGILCSHYQLMAGHFIFSPSFPSSPAPQQKGLAAGRRKGSVNTLAALLSPRACSWKASCWY